MRRPAARADRAGRVGLPDDRRQSSRWPRGACPARGQRVPCTRAQTEQGAAREGQKGGIRAGAGGTEVSRPAVSAPGDGRPEPPGSQRVAPRHRRDVNMAGVAGNEKLTAMTGAILLVGFAVEGFTILGVRRMLFLHFFVGMLLIGPAVLKIGSTGFRFARYYTGSAPYVRKGPPSPVLRLLGPLVILTSIAVIGTGVILGVAGPSSGQWLFLHKASFILWFGVMTIHVLNYAPRLPRMLA